MSGRNRVFRPAPLVKKPFSFFSRSGFFRCPPSWEPSPSERGGRYGCFLPVGRSPVLPFSCFSDSTLIFSAGRERAALQGSCWDMKGPAFTGKPGRPAFIFSWKAGERFLLRKGPPAFAFRPFQRRAVAPFDPPASIPAFRFPEDIAQTAFR